MLECIAYLSDPDETGLDLAVRLAEFEKAAHIFGGSALVLSGGATLGFFHLGVVKALFEHDLLPDVISGASMGALVTCGTGVRTDAELRALFANPRVIRTDAIRRLPSTRAARARAVYDPARLEEVVAHSLAEQAYGGDIDIHPRIRPLALLRAMSNISHNELEKPILKGERATWPLLARIRDQTCVERALEAAILRLKT